MFQEADYVSLLPARLCRITGYDRGYVNIFKALLAFRAADAVKSARSQLKRRNFFRTPGRRVAPRSGPGHVENPVCRGPAERPRSTQGRPRLVWDRRQRTRAESRRPAAEPGFISRLLEPDRYARGRRPDRGPRPGRSAGDSDSARRSPRRRSVRRPERRRPGRAGRSPLRRRP